MALHLSLKHARSALLLMALALISCWEVEADLVVSTHAIDFGTNRESAIVNVYNDSYDNTLTSGVVTLQYQFKPDRPWLKVTPASGSAGEGERISHTVSVDRSLMVYGENLATIAVTSNGGRDTILIKAVRSVPGCGDPPSAPHSPSPATGATGLPTLLALSWGGGDSQCDPLTATYDVYFGNTTPPPFHHNNDSLKVWTPEPLEYNTFYYWRIVAKDANGSTSSREWAFRTVCNLGPTPVTLTSPADDATGVSVNSLLVWSGGNTQCPNLNRSYDIYFGTTSPPPLVSNTTFKSWDPELVKGTTYYWRIVANDPNGTQSSPEFSFTTEQAQCTTRASAVTLVSPANNATNVALSTDLVWSGGDSQCPGLTATYDVYFGTTSPPPFSHNNGTTKSWDAPLQNNTTYYWYVAAKDANGSVLSAERMFRTPCVLPPTAPTPLSPADGATNVGIGDNLTWSNGTSQCSGLIATYDVYFGTTSPPPLAGNNGSNKTWEPGLMLPGVKYYWKIVAKDANGSTSSAEQDFTVGLLPCTSGPTNVSLQSPADGATDVSRNADISWTGGNSQCEGLTATYDVYFGTASPPPLDHNNGSAKTWDPGTLDASTRYYWRIVAKDANGSVSSSERDFTTEALPCTAGPSAVTLLSPVDGATDVSLGARISWSGGNSQCNGLTATYDVYFGAVSPPPLDHNNGTAKTWAPGDLQPSTTYYWRIVATDANGSVSSSQRDFTTVCNAVPGAVTLLSPVDGATGVSLDADISWTGGNSQCNGLTATYDVYFGTVSPPPLDHNNGSAKSWDPGTLDPSTRYYWRIVAKDANGSVSSSERDFTTACTALPTAVTLQSPADGATGVALDADLSWTGGDSQCSGLTATYDVYFGTVSPPPLHHNNGSTKAWDPGALDPGETYYWRIVAKDANGSVPSPERDFTTEIPACVLPPTVATVTSPVHNATGVSINGNLVWSGGTSQCEGLTATYDVYFGTSSPPPFNHNNGVVKSFDPGTLQNATVYYWQIVSKDANGETAGPVWSFTTEALCSSPPTAPSNPNPSNGATNRNENSNLAWQGGLSTCGLPVTYDVYFGTNPTPGEEQKLGSTVEPSWNLPTLNKSTTYYWKVIARDANGESTGPVWTFTTRN